MSLVFSAFVPHPPLLIPQIGKDNLARLEDTAKAYEKLALALEKSGAETLLIISPHGQILNNIFTVNLNPTFNYNFEEFGDFATKGEFLGDFVLAEWLKKDTTQQNLIHLISNPLLDHGTTVPLLLLTEKLKQFKIVPLYYSGLSCDEHFRFGKLIEESINSYSKRVAVIASGDLSHCLAKDSPAEYSPKGKKFDSKLIEYLNKSQTEKIKNLDENLINEACECGLKSLLILLGILDNKNYTPQLLSYEAPFGVGYLVMNFKIAS